MLCILYTNSYLENLRGNLPCEQLLTYCPTASGFCGVAVSQLSSLIWKGPSWSLLLQDLKCSTVLVWIMAPSPDRFSSFLCGNGHNHCRKLQLPSPPGVEGMWTDQHLPQLWGVLQTLVEEPAQNYHTLFHKSASNVTITEVSTAFTQL